jgi:uncharacterized protein (TIGR00369 family)
MADLASREGAETFQPRDPNYAARVRDSFARQGAMTLIGATLARVEPGAVDVALDYRPELSQQHGFFHGGIVGTVADTAGGYAAFTLSGAEDSVLTVEYKLNLVAPADGETLIARGRVLKPGRTLTIVRGDVVVLRDGRERLCATMLQTLMTLAGRPDRPA